MNLGFGTAILIAICLVISFFDKKIFKSKFYTLIASILHMATSVNFLIFAHYGNGLIGFFMALLAVCYAAIAISYLEISGRNEEKKMGLFKALCILLIAGLAFFVLLVLYPFWWLFCQVVNFIGIKGVRNVGGKLETPIVFYEHPVTKRVVAFIATIHIAEQEYFAALKRRIELLPDFKILFENVGKLSPEEEQSLSEKERDVAQTFNDVFAAMREIGDVMSLQFQKEGLVYPPSWINTDIKLRDIIRSFAQQNITITDMKKGKKLDELLDDKAMRICFEWLTNKAFAQFVPIAVFTNILSFFSNKKKMVMRLILDERNKKAVQGINQYLEDGNVATIWGAAHLDGIENELKRAGFREISREWYTAYHIRKLSFIKCLMGMIGAIKAAKDKDSAVS